MLKSEQNLKEAMARKAAKILMDIKETEEELMVKQLIILGEVIRRKQAKEGTRKQSAALQRPLQECEDGKEQVRQLDSESQPRQGGT